MTPEKIKNIIDKAPFEKSRDICKISIIERTNDYSIDIYFTNPGGFVNRTVSE